MDKQKISIDDLFRQRLSDKEAPLPPGSWGRMEELLDAKMPVGVTPVARENSRRRWAFLLLGLLAAGGGGYAYQQSIQKEHLLADASAKIPFPEKRTTPPVLSATPAIAPVIPAVRPTAPTQKPKQKKTVSTTLAVRKTTSPQTKAAPTKSDSQTASVKPKFERPVTAPVVKIVVPQPVAEKPSLNIVREEIPFLPSVASRLTDVFSGKILSEYNLTRVENYLFSQISGKGTPVSETPEKAWSAKTPSGTPRLSAPAMQMKEAVNATSIVAAAVASSVSPVAVPVTLNASTPAPLSVETQQETPQTPVAKIEEALDEVRSNQFSMGLLAGINSTLSGGSGALQGLHAGLWGILKLSEKWSIGGDLKYLFRLNNSMDLKDDAYSTQIFNETPVTSGPKQYTAIRTDVDSTLRRYSFTSYNSIELPLYVRYSHNRFSVYGGPNMTFHFRPSVTRTDTKIGTISRYDTLLANQPLPVGVSRASEVTFSDFDSRFSLGYLVGAQYRLSPALGLDLRLSHQVWDNLQNRSAGAGKVSTTYIQIPTLQLSVNYRFSKKTPQPTVKKP